MVALSCGWLSCPPPDSSKGLRSPACARREVCCSPAGCGAGAVGTFAMVWTLQRGHVTRDTGSDQVVCEAGLLCLK